MAVAQQVPVPPGQPAVSVRHNAGLARDGDEVVGVGAAYRGVFRAGGLEITPAFGDAVPTAIGAWFAAAAVRRAGVVQELVAPGLPELDGLRAQQLRGHGVLERFDFAPDGVEHSLVFAAPPAGRGDLVVRVNVQTTLTPQSLADGTVRFWRDDLGGIAVGGVTGIDAGGARVRGSLRWTGSELEYVLPGGFVDAAAYPLVLDPVIGPQFVLGGADDVETDVAYDPGSNAYLAVWKRRYATTDHDILAQRLDASGALLGATLLLETASSIVASKPCCAPVRSRSAFAVVWQQSSGPFGPFDIRARSVVGASGALSTAVSVVATAEDEFAPCISGEVTTVDDDVLVAWETPTGLYTMQLTLPVSLVPTPSTIVTLTTSDFAQRPAFSKTGGTVGQHMVVWEEESVLGDTQIRGRVVTRNLTLLTPITVLTTSTRHKANPRVDGDGTNFLLAFERQEANSTLSDLIVRRLGYAAGTLSLQTAEVAVEASGLRDEAMPDVAWLGARWAVALQERSSGLDDNVVVWMLRDDCQPCSGRIVLQGLDPTASHGREFQPRLANRWAGLEQAAESLLVFSEAQVAPPFLSTSVAQRLEAIGPGVPPATIANGCGLGGAAGSSGGPMVLGNAGFRFAVTGLQPTAVVFLSLSFPGPLPPPCGVCVVPNPVALLFQPNLGGTASYPLPVPCDATFLGLPIDTQWLSFFSGATPCPLAADLSASALVRFTIAD